MTTTIAIYSVQVSQGESTRSIAKTAQSRSWSEDRLDKDLSDSTFEDTQKPARTRPTKSENERRVAAISHRRTAGVAWTSLRATNHGGHFAVAANVSDREVQTSEQEG